MQLGCIHGSNIHLSVQQQTLQGNLRKSYLGPLGVTTTHSVRMQTAAFLLTGQPPNPTAPLWQGGNSGGGGGGMWPPDPSAQRWPGSGPASFPSEPQWPGTGPASGPAPSPYGPGWHGPGPASGPTPSPSGPGWHGPAPQQNLVRMDGLMDG